ncbi:MAG: hypothetical protein ACREBV_08450 [Candidatus Zixiibacteriota bacterium]
MDADVVRIIIDAPQEFNTEVVGKVAGGYIGLSHGPALRRDEDTSCGLPA